MTAATSSTLKATSPAPAPLGRLEKSILVRRPDVEPEDAMDG